jgi:hypothetical protein
MDTICPLVKSRDCVKEVCELWTVDRCAFRAIAETIAKAVDYFTVPRIADNLPPIDDWKSIPLTGESILTKDLKNG